MPFIGLCVKPVFIFSGTWQCHTLHITLMYSIHTLTWVSGDLSNLYFLNTFTKHALASSSANFMPIQLLWPQPNGIWDIGFLSSLLSGLNLKIASLYKLSLILNLFGLKTSGWSQCSGKRWRSWMGIITVNPSRKVTPLIVQVSLQLREVL